MQQKSDTERQMDEALQLIYAKYGTNLQAFFDDVRQVTAERNPPPPPVRVTEREMFRLITNEVERARNLMPGRTDMFVALTEEVGELAQALIDQKYKQGQNMAVLSEAVQVAAMAVRIATEGDTSFPYVPPQEIAAPRMGWGKGEPGR